MPLSGTIQGSVTAQPSTSTTKPFSFYFTWSATQNIENNYSDVTVKTFWATKNTSWGFDTVGSRNASITINGTTTSIAQRFDCSPWPTDGIFLIQTATTRVYHDADGSKSITISARANGHASTWGPSSSTASSGDCTASGTITLDTIPRASTITSASSVTLGNACSIKWTPASSDFKYTIKFSIGSWSYTTGYITPSTTSTYTYTGYTISGTTTANNTTIYKQIPSSPIGTMTATLTTYNSSGTQIGSSDAETFTVTIPSGIKPTVGTITVDPVNITTSDGASQNVLVKDKNKITISASNCKAGDGSSIKSYTFEVLSGSTVIAQNTTTDTSVQLGPFSKTGVLKFRVTVTDNRERSTNNSGSEPTWECYDYSVPTFTSFDIFRSKSGGVVDMNGAYIRCNYVQKYSSVGSTNKVTVTAYYNDKSKTGSNGVVDIDLGGDVTTTYKVYLVITDNYGGRNTTSTVTIFGQARILNITSDGTGIAIGKMAEQNELFECRWPAKFNNGCTISGGGATINGAMSINNGVTINNGATINGALKVGQSTINSTDTVLTSSNVGSYAATSSSLNNYLKLNGGALTGKLTLGENLYHQSSTAGLDCKNSDIINANGIYFGDATDSAGEGVNFYRDGSTWDTLYVSGGALKFNPGRSTSGSLGGHTIYNSSNFRRGTCTLSSSGSGTTVTFSSALAGTPTVILTPLTTSAGVIPGKVRSVSSTGFTAIIGGSAVDSALFAYLAVYF